MSQFQRFLVKTKKVSLKIIVQKKKTSKNKRTWKEDSEIANSFLLNMKMYNTSDGDAEAFYVFFSFSPDYERLPAS